MTKPVTLVSQGKHRYFQLASADVAKALEGLLSITSFEVPAFKASTPCHLRHARTYYDHLAGEVGVMLHDASLVGEWMCEEQGDYGLTQMGMDLTSDTQARRRFAFPCLDWSQRCAHVDGTLGAALLGRIVRDKWLYLPWIRVH